MQTFIQIGQNDVVPLAKQSAQLFQIIINLSQRVPAPKAKVNGKNLTEYQSYIADILKGYPGATLDEHELAGKEEGALEEMLLEQAHNFLDKMDAFKKNIETSTTTLTSKELSKLNAHYARFRQFLHEFQFDKKPIFYADRILRRIEALNELLMAEPSLERKSDYLDEIGRWHSILMGKESDKKSEILEQSSGEYFKHSTDVQVQRIRNVAARTYDEASSAVSRAISEHYGQEVFISIPGAYQSELIHQTPFNAGSCDLLGKRESQ